MATIIPMVQWKMTLHKVKIPEILNNHWKLRYPDVLVNFDNAVNYFFSIL